MRAELPSPEVGAGCSIVPAPSASTTSFAQEVSSEEIEWTSTSRALSCNGGGPWTGGGIEACPASASTSWAASFAALTPAAATPASVVSGAPVYATLASVVLGAPTSATSASVILGAPASIVSALGI